jgi:hypothetical protein
MSGPNGARNWSQAKVRSLEASLCPTAPTIAELCLLPHPLALGRYFVSHYISSLRKMRKLKSRETWWLD